MNRRRRVLCGSAAVLLGSAFALPGAAWAADSDDIPPEQQIKERAEARWRALSEGDFPRAYGFESPAYREITSVERYRARFGGGVVWHGAEVTKVELAESGEAADVLLTLEYTAQPPSGGAFRNRRGLKEKWVKTDGEWWIVR